MSLVSLETGDWLSLLCFAAMASGDTNFYSFIFVQALFGSQWPFLRHPGFPWMLFSLCQRRRALISASRNSSCWKYWAKGISWVYVRTEFGREVWKCTIYSMYVMYIINHISTVSCWTHSVCMYVQSISLESCLAGTEREEGGTRKVWSLFLCVGWVLDLSRSTFMSQAHNPGRPGEPFCC